MVLLGRGKRISLSMMIICLRSMTEVFVEEIGDTETKWMDQERLD